MPDLHRLQVSCPDGDPGNTKVLLDGAPMKGVISIAVKISNDSLVEATIEQYVDWSLDATVVERKFVSPTNGDALSG
jgi:hypothetical protein